MQISSAWKARIRWFAAEYVIVVAGVLTAVAIAGWANRRQDSARERAYLHQLMADLARTESLVVAADSAMAPRDRAGALFVQSFYAPDMPPTDSLAMWLFRANWYERPRPVMGTAQALITTGDLRLLRDDALRSAVTAYVESMVNWLDEQQAYLELWTRAIEAVDEVVVVDALARGWTDAQIDSAAHTNPLSQLPAGVRVPPFPPDWNALRRNRTLFRGTEQMNLAKQNLRYVRTAMLSETRALKGQIEKLEQADSR